MAKMSNRDDEKKLCNSELIDLLSAAKHSEHVLSINDFRYLKAMVRLLLDQEYADRHLQILTTIINGVCDGVKNSLLAEETLLSLMMREALSGARVISVAYVALAVNISRDRDDCVRLLPYIDNAEKAVGHTLSAFNRCNKSSHLYGHLLLNLTQLENVRHAVLKSDIDGFCQLMQSDSVQQKQIAISILRNCCIDVECHRLIFLKKQSILTALLHPLMVDGNYKRTEEIWSVWQEYLNVGKQMDSDCAIRKSALQALYRLCNARFGREELRSLGVYYILREYHKLEGDKENFAICDDVVSLLIKTEEEIGCDSLMQWADAMDRGDQSGRSSVGAQLEQKTS